MTDKEMAEAAAKFERRIEGMNSFGSGAPKGLGAAAVDVCDTVELAVFAIRQHGIEPTGGEALALALAILDRADAQQKNKTREAA